VSVGVGHIDLATAHHAINHRAEDTQKQPCTHASSSEQQGGEQHPHRRGEGDGQLAAAPGGSGDGVRHG